jgi:hypothetical protein
VVRWAAAAACSVEDDGELLTYPLLTDEVLEPLRPQCRIDDLVVGARVRRHKLL